MIDSNTTVGATKARTRLPALLKRVARGEALTITKYGTPVAVLAPVGNPRSAIKRALAELKEFRKSHDLESVTLKELAENS